MTWRPVDQECCNVLLRLLGNPMRRQRKPRSQRCLRYFRRLQFSKSQGPALPRRQSLVRIAPFDLGAIHARNWPQAFHIGCRVLGHRHRAGVLPFLRSQSYRRPAHIYARICTPANCSANALDEKAANSTEAAVILIVMVSLAVKKRPSPTIACAVIRSRITRRVRDPVEAMVLT